MQPTKAICTVCGETFTKRQPHHKICSDPCRETARSKNRAKPSEGECAICGKSFNKKQPSHKYCSNPCRETAQRKKSYKYYPIEKRYASEGECAICGKSFNKKQPSHKYCSNPCRETAYEKQKIEAVKSYVRKWEPITSNCSLCGTPFTKTSPNHKYCSSDCRLVATKERYKKESSKEDHILHPAKPLDDKTYFAIDWIDCRSERDFRDWFKKNYGLLGFSKLLTEKKAAGTIILGTEAGMIMRVRTSYSISNVPRNSFDPSDCDLIICYKVGAERREYRGVPIISIFLEDRSKRRTALSEHFEKVFDLLFTQLKDGLLTNPYFNTEKQVYFQRLIEGAVQQNLGDFPPKTKMSDFEERQYFENLVKHTAGKI